MQLGMNQKTATQLLQAANLPVGEFICNKPRPAAARPIADTAKVNIIIQHEDEELPEEAAVDFTKKGKQRYQLVQRGRYFGCYDAVDATVVLFASEREARKHIHDLLHHREVFQSFYGGKHNRRPQELQPVE